MFDANLEFLIADEPPVSFEINLDKKSEGIHERALLSSRKYLVAEAELLDAIIEVDRFKIYECFGFTHLSPYCVKYLGLSEDVAGNFVRVARKSVQVPELKAAIDSGLSVGKAKTIASVITSGNQSDWIEKALNLPKHKLEREVAKVSPYSPRREQAKPVGEDKIWVGFELSDAEMALLRRAQDLVSQKLRKPATHTRRNSRKTIPAAVKHWVNLRDRGECQARLPNGGKCKSKRWVDHHHIVPRSVGGRDVAENLTTLCSSHHRMHHRGTS